jgi:hypothetical protein
VSTPRPDEPFRFTEQPPDPETSPAMTWAMRVLGLVAVAVLSGAVYWYINDKPAGTQQTQDTTTAPREGVYVFTPHEKVLKPRVDSDCASHAYNKTQAFLAQPNTCEKVTQQLFTTKVGDRLALVSVAVVQMTSPEKAAELRALTSQNNTGNVNDLVKEGVVTVGGLKTLANGYAVSEAAEIVTIVEADFNPKGAPADEDVLDNVCADALRLGKDMTAAS